MITINYPLISTLRKMRGGQLLYDIAYLFVLFSKTFCNNIYDCIKLANNAADDRTRLFFICVSLSINIEATIIRSDMQSRIISYLTLREYVSKILKISHSYVCDMKWPDLPNLPNLVDSVTPTI